MIKPIGYSTQPPAVTSVHPTSQTTNGVEQDKPSMPIRIVDRVTLSSQGKTLSRQHPSGQEASYGSSILSYEIRRPYTSPKMAEQFQSYTLKIKV